ncbi:hypothetical protein V5799_021622 [Amblyomma americanum]|uniref:Uncharacterized protein n=1 Tax=Amblyomma americanum TaxID=6943 RepID=A0AAQ4FMU5_AMBAM
MQFRDYLGLGPGLYLLLGKVIVLFLWRRHPERMRTYGLLISFCLHWAYWQTRQQAAYTAHVRMHGHPPHHCHQGYKFLWTRVSGDNLEDCEAYRRVTSLADPLFVVANLINEVFLALLRDISNALYWYAYALLKISIACTVLVMIVVVLLLVKEFMRPRWRDAS